MTADPQAITPADRVGEIVPPDPDTVALDVYRRLVDETGKPTGYLKRERMRTLGEVFADLNARIDVVVCDKCGHERPRKPKDCCTPHSGCGGEYRWFLDEYFHGPERNDDPVPHNFRWIACYPVTGGSEGHYVHVELLSIVETVEIADPADPYGMGKPLTVHPKRLPYGQGYMVTTRLALGKTFRGMDHAAEIARRCAKLLGA